MRTASTITLAAIISTGAASAASASSRAADDFKVNGVYEVRVAQTQVSQQPQGRTAVAATLVKGEKFKVTELAADNWLKVLAMGKAGETPGFLHKSRASVVIKDSASTPLSGILSGRSDKTEIEASAAAKGVEPETELVLRSRGGSAQASARLAALRQRRSAITAKQADEFSAAFGKSVSP